MKKIILSALVASTVAIAADTNKNDQLVTHTELGYVETQGNTKTKTFSLDTKAKKGWGKHILNAKLTAQYASDHDIETKNKFLVELQYNYEFTDRFAFDYLAGYTEDKFSSFDYQFYTGPGAKYKVIVSKKHNLSLEANILYALDRYSNIEYADLAKTQVISYPNPNNVAVVATDPAYSSEYTSYRVKGIYNWAIQENLKFDQELSIRGSAEDSNVYFTHSKSAITNKISDIFSAGISYTADYTNQPSVGRAKTDTTIALNLIIDY
ncbi:DUF481 domain-containing protein [Sulfurimonas sp.]